MQTELEIMNELMGIITQTDEWERIQMTNPQIKTAEAALDLALKNVFHVVPKEMYGPLEDCARNVAFAYVDAAILYGIQVADAIHAVAAKPNALSQHIMNRIAAQRAAQP